MSTVDSILLGAPLEFGGRENYEAWRDWCFANALCRFRLRLVPSNMGDVFAVGDDVVLVGYVRDKAHAGEENLGGPMFVRPHDLDGNVYPVGDSHYWHFFANVGDGTLRGIWGSLISYGEPRSPAAYLVRDDAVGLVAATDYPHLCPRCRGPAYVGFREIDCQRKCR